MVGSERSNERFEKVFFVADPGQRQPCSGLFSDVVSIARRVKY